MSQYSLRPLRKTQILKAKYIEICKLNESRSLSAGSVSSASPMAGSPRCFDGWWNLISLSYLIIKERPHLLTMAGSPRCFDGWWNLISLSYLTIYGRPHLHHSKESIWCDNLIILWKSPYPVQDIEPTAEIPPNMFICCWRFFNF